MTPVSTISSREKKKKKSSHCLFSSSCRDLQASVVAEGLRQSAARPQTPSQRGWIPPWRDACSSSRSLNHCCCDLSFYGHMYEAKHQIYIVTKMKGEKKKTLPLDFSIGQHQF